MFKLVNEDLLMNRINKLKEYLNFLDEIKNYSEIEYAKDPYIYASSERFLHLAIECSLDIGNHIISDMMYRKPETNKEIFNILYENDIISLDLKNKLEKMASFRNILVHDYIDLEKKQVYKIIINNCDDLKEFIKEVINYFYE